jgi:hypothetical protein
MDEHGHGEPAISDYCYGSDSTDRLRLELRPPPAEVTLMAQTETSEETNMDAQKMREVGEQQHEPPTAPKAKEGRGKKRKRSTSRTRKKKRQKNGNDTGTTDD